MGPKIILVSMIGLLAAAPRTSSAQEWLHRNPLAWRTTIELDARHEKSGESKASTEYDLETRLWMSQSGFVLDPRIGRFSIDLEPVITRGEFKGPGRQEKRNGQVLNFDISAAALEGTPGPLGYEVEVSRETGTDEASLGSRNDYRTDRHYLAVRFKNTAFPSTLSYTERMRDDTYTAGLSGIATQRNDTEKVLGFRGRSSKMNILAERRWFDDKIEANNLDFMQDRFEVNHYLEWGRGSRLDSHVDYEDRRGSSPIKRFSLLETAGLYHTGSLSSTINYGYTWSEQTYTTSTHAANYTLTHTLYSNLITRMELKARASDYQISKEDEYEADLSYDYRKKIPWDGTFFAELGSGYGVTDRRVEQEGVLQITDENKTVGVTLVVLLAERFIRTDTVVVTDQTGTITYTSGADYLVVPTASNQTEIQIVAGGLINSGDTILVSYEYDSEPTAKFSSVPYHFGARADFGWIAIYHRTSGTSEDLISGTDSGNLNNRWSSATGVELRWRRRTTRAIARGEFRAEKTNDLRVNTWQLTQTVTHNFTRTSSATLGANEIFSKSSTRDIRSYSADASVTFRPVYRLTVRPHLSAWYREEKGVSREELYTANLDLEWAYRQFELRLRYKHEARRGTITRRDEDRILLTLVRRSG